MPLIWLLLLMAPAQAHVGHFWHTVGVNIDGRHLTIDHHLNFPSGEHTVFLESVKPKDEAEELAAFVAKHDVGGPHVYLGGKRLKCEGPAATRGEHGSHYLLTVSERCELPPGPLELTLKGDSVWTNRLVPIEVRALVSEPTIEGKGQVLAGQEIGPWVGAMTWGTTLRFKVARLGAKEAK